MSIYDEDWGEVTTPRRVTLREQEQAGLTRRNTYVPARTTSERQLLPVQSPANGALGELVTGLMAEAHTIHQADPVSRGKALFIKTMGISLFLWGLTIAALAMNEMLSFMMWLLWASIEGGICFLVLAYLDWREHPSAIRWQWTQGLLGMMEREQEARLRAQYGDWDR
jgi:hypothetical protein